MKITFLKLNSKKTFKNNGNKLTKSNTLLEDVDNEAYLKE